MKSLRSLDRRMGFGLGAFGILLGMVAPAVVPAFASAAGQVTNRSIQLSSTTLSATGVKYTAGLTPATSGSNGSYTDATDVFVDLMFCSNDPIIGDSCTAPNGMSVASATVDSSDTTGSTVVGTSGANYITLSIPKANITAGSAISIPLDGVTNPSDSSSDLTNDTFYGRMETFDTQAHATAAAAAGATTTGIVDYGGVALELNSNFGVNATVEESMTFCVSGSAPTAGCATGVTSPTVNLGSQVGTQYILGNTLSTATDYAQISTNAVDGAVVNMKSDATGCGGLYLKANATKCGIPPQTTTATGIGTGVGLFGLTVGSESGATGGATPTGTIAPGTGYDGTHYYMNYVSGDATGVTSPYGSALLNTSSAPISNENVPIVFGADTSPTTPAGQYTANLNMIAVGTF